MTTTNNSWRLRIHWSVIMALALASIARANADQTFSYNISLTTQPLADGTVDPNPPFSLDFQFVAGESPGHNNTATFSNFNFGTGFAIDPLPTTLQDPTFPSPGDGLFDAQFQPGDQVSFSLNLTGNIEQGPNPDAFSFAILDGNSNDVNASSPNGAFVTINEPTVAGNSPSIAIYNFDGLIATVTPVPEPAPWTSIGLGTLITLFVLHFRRITAPKDRRMC